MSKTTEHYDRVRGFMQLAGQATPAWPTDMDRDTRELRARLIMEEALETINKGLGLEVFSDDGELVAEDFFFFRAHGPGDNVELLDGCCDLAVVTTGTLIAAGLTDAEPQRLVDENNLAKFGPGSYRRDDGKWIKPSDHRPPDLAAELDRQRIWSSGGGDNPTRSSDGMFWHPAIPWNRMPEMYDLTPFLHVLGYEAFKVDMEGDAPGPLMDEYADGSTEAIAEWEPSMPQGSGWFLGAKYDTEDGPQAVWLRPDDDRRQPGGKAW